MLANGLVSVKHSKIPVRIGDIVKKISRAQDSVEAANEWGSDNDNVLKSDKTYNSHSPISESGPYTSPFNST